MRPFLVRLCGAIPILKFSSLASNLLAQIGTPDAQPSGGLRVAIEWFLDRSLFQDCVLVALGEVTTYSKDVLRYLRSIAFREGLAV